MPFRVISSSTAAASLASGPSIFFSQSSQPYSHFSSGWRETAVSIQRHGSPLGRRNAGRSPDLSLSGSAFCMKVR